MRNPGGLCVMFREWLLAGGESGRPGGESGSPFLRYSGGEELWILQGELMCSIPAPARFSAGRQGEWL